MDLIDIYRTLTERLEYTFFPGTQGTFYIDHKLGHKTSLNKFKLKENISSIFSDHDGMNLGINYRKKNRKKYKNVGKKFNRSTIKLREIRKYFEKNENENIATIFLDATKAA